MVDWKAIRQHENDLRIARGKFHIEQHIAMRELLAEMRDEYLDPNVSMHFSQAAEHWAKEIQRLEQELLRLKPCDELFKLVGEEGYDYLQKFWNGSLNVKTTVMKVEGIHGKYYYDAGAPRMVDMSTREVVGYGHERTYIITFQHFQFADRRYALYLVDEMNAVFVDTSVA